MRRTTQTGIVRHGYRTRQTQVPDSVGQAPWCGDPPERQVHIPRNVGHDIKPASTPRAHCTHGADRACGPAHARLHSRGICNREKVQKGLKWCKNEMVVWFTAAARQRRRLRRVPLVRQVPRNGHAWCRPVTPRPRHRRCCPATCRSSCSGSRGCSPQPRTREGSARPPCC